MKLCGAGLHDLDDPAVAYIVPGTGRRNCGPCRRAVGRRRVQTQAFKLLTRPRDRTRREQHRREALQKYGGQCSTCGETDIEVLELDHVNGGGNGMGGGRLVAWLRKNSWPTAPPLQVLCANCHSRKTKAEARARRMPA